MTLSRPGPAPPVLTPGRRTAGWLAPLGLTFLGLVMGLAVAEVGLRFLVPIEPVFVEWDPVLGVRHRAGMKGTWYRETRAPVRVELNSLGFRNGPLERRKPAGTVRVLMLGDSYLEGMQIPFHQLVSERLRVRLQQAMPAKRVEVLNGGVAGWGQSEQSLYLAQRAWPYEPDLVVSFLNLGNDLRDNWYRTGSPVRPSYELRGDSLVLHPPFLPPWKIFLRDRVLAHLAIPKLVRMYFIHRFEWARLWAVKQGLILRNVGKPRSREEEDAVLEIGRRLYGRMAAECARHRVPLVVLQFPYGLQLVRFYPDTSYTSSKLRRGAPGASQPYEYLGEEMARFFLRSGMSFVRADSAFAAAVSRGDTLYIDFDGHWTARGHDVAASLLAEHILSRGLLPGTDPPAGGAIR